MLLHFNSRFRPNLNEPSYNYTQTLNLPLGTQKLTKCKVTSCTIPNSIANINNYVLKWSEPSAGVGPQITKSISIPQGQYTITTLCSTLQSLMASESSLPVPNFTVSQSSIDAKIIFQVPTYGGTPVTAWQLLWSQSTAKLATMCGFTTTNTALAGNAFTSINTYNLSVPQMFYVYISFLPQAIIPGSSFNASFPISMNSNSGLQGTAYPDMEIPLLNPITGQQVRVQLLMDDGELANLRQIEWNITLQLS